MKKIIILILIIITLTTICILFQKQYKYPIGRDTYDAFGDGSFQLGKYYIINSSGESEKKIALLFRGETLEREVFEYFTYLNFLFTHGKNGYVICDYEKNRYNIYNDLDDIPYEYNKIIKNHKFYQIK